MSDKRTQIEAILDYIKCNHTITSMEAFQMFGATRLAAVIFELRKHGHLINTIECSVCNRYGTITNYAKYEYIEFNGLDNTIAVQKLRGEL